MKHNIVLILVLGLCICACGSKNYAGDSKKFPEKITAGVLYFDIYSNSKELEPYRAGLTDMFIGKLKELMPELNVVERSKLDNVMGEFQLSETGAIDSETAQKIGRMLGAQTLYYGSVTSSFGKEMCINGRLVRVETGEVLSAGQNVCSFSDKDVFDSVDKIAKKLAATIKADYKTLIADVYYSKGRTAEESGDKDGAIRFYQQSLQFSSDHKLSQKALVRLKL